MNKEEIVGFMKAEIAAILNEEPEEIDEDMNFMKIGVSSVQALKIVNRLRRKLEININPVALFEFKTISEFAGHLSECVEEKVSL
ncbi:acyl carrier protein [Paenibacillus alvei]|uniref:acyl carrier protein n=1 Tax=Paenibacillus alvei TaxID=44250 RepID=UPI000385B219|nr:acyl carrier protein [Paenibacillus alvei]EPY11884.1 putative acyl carrier protein [Paenibacillus alvei A6-6i-x]